MEKKFYSYNKELKAEADYCLQQIEYAYSDIHRMILSIEYASDDAGDNDFAFIRSRLFEDTRAEVDFMEREINRLEKEYNTIKSESEK